MSILYGFNHIHQFDTLKNMSFEEWHIACNKLSSIIDELMEHKRPIVDNIDLLLDVQRAKLRAFVFNMTDQPQECQWQIAGFACYKMLYYLKNRSEFNCKENVEHLFGVDILCIHLWLIMYDERIDKIYRLLIGHL